MNAVPPIAAGAGLGGVQKAPLDPAADSAKADAHEGCNFSALDQRRQLLNGRKQVAHGATGRLIDTHDFPWNGPRRPGQMNRSAP